jgi:hypothetical protein
MLLIHLLNNLRIVFKYILFFVGQNAHFLRILDYNYDQMRAILKFEAYIIEQRHPLTKFLTHIFYHQSV